RATAGTVEPGNELVLNSTPAATASRVRIAGARSRMDAISSTAGARAACPRKKLAKGSPRTTARVAQATAARVPSRISASRNASQRKNRVRDASRAEATDPNSRAGAQARKIPKKTRSSPTTG